MFSPFMIHAPTIPLAAFCQSMSCWPLPVKSPNPTICQSGVAIPKLAFAVIVAPLSFHARTSPEFWFRQINSGCRISVEISGTDQLPVYGSHPDEFT